MLGISTSAWSRQVRGETVTHSRRRLRMVRSKLRLKILGLCAVLVGMFAFAVAAQAEPGAYWLVNGAKISEALLPTVLAETDVVGTLLTELGGKFIHIKCPTINLVGAHLVEPVGKILGKIDFKGCTF